MAYVITDACIKDFACAPECAVAAISPAAATDLVSLRTRAAIINLSQTDNFDALFLNHLYLQPLKT